MHPELDGRTLGIVNSFNILESGLSGGQKKSNSTPENYHLDELFQALRPREGGSTHSYFMAHKLNLSVEKELVLHLLRYPIG